MLEKLTWEQTKQSPEFQRGLKEFREGKVNKPKGVNYSWYKTKVSAKKYNDYYSKIGSYTLLAKYKEGKNEFADIGFLAVIPPKDCLEITNPEELRQIQLHREATNQMPQPMIKQ